jgi:hypothetical protein
VLLLPKSKVPPGGDSFSIIGRWNGSLKVAGVCIETSKFKFGFLNQILPKPYAFEYRHVYRDIYLLHAPTAFLTISLNYQDYRTTLKRATHSLQRSNIKILKAAFMTIKQLLACEDEGVWAHHY